MSDHRIETRADRLRVLLLAFGEEPTLSMQNAFAARMIPRGWFEYMGGTLGLEHTDLADDVTLAMQCAALGGEIRDRQWAALERIDALIAQAASGPLPAAQQRELACAFIELGWQHEPPGETCPDDVT